MPDTYAETLLLRAKVEQRAPHIEVATGGKAPKEAIAKMTVPTENWFEVSSDPE
jgi:hypothetical protein